MTSIFKENNSLNSEEIMNHLSDISKEIFNDSLYVKLLDNGDIEFIGQGFDFYWWKENAPFLDYENEDDDDNLIEIPRSIDHYTFSENPRSKHIAWIQEIVTKELCKRMSLNLYYGGVGHIPNPDPYPNTFKDYTSRGWFLEGNFIKRYFKQKLINENYKRYDGYAKEKLPSDLYESIF